MSGNASRPVTRSQSQGHNKILHDQRSCDFCGSSCKGFPSFRCAKCDFSLHLSCGPLPCTIKHASHVHRLVIQDYYVEDNESDMFACHICEERRDPRLRIYQCMEGCTMICEVACVLTEVVALLRGELGAIKLETPYPRIACKVITRDSILEEISNANKRDKDETTNKCIFSNSEIWEMCMGLSAFEKEETFDTEVLEEKDMLKRQHNEERTKSQIKFASHGKDDTSNLTTEVLCLHRDESIYTYSRKALQGFTEQLEQDLYMHDEAIFQQHDGSSTVGDFSLPEILQPVCEELVEKYDILGPPWDGFDYYYRRFHLFYICSIVHDMCMTKVVDVQKEKIQTWLDNLKRLYSIGEGTVFKVNFLIKHARRVARAHFIVQARHIVDTKSSNLRKEEEELSTRRRELIRELNEIEMKLEENEKERKKHNVYKATGSSELKREYSDALKIKWRPCFQLFSDKS